MRAGTILVAGAVAACGGNGDGNGNGGGNLCGRLSLNNVSGMPAVSTRCSNPSLTLTDIRRNNLGQTVGYRFSARCPDGSESYSGEVTRIDWSAASTSPSTGRSASRARRCPTPASSCPTRGAGTTSIATMTRAT
jgi:hypothetical protein